MIMPIEHEVGAGRDGVRDPVGAIDESPAPREIATQEVVMEDEHAEVAGRCGGEPLTRVDPLRRTDRPHHAEVARPPRERIGAHAVAGVEPYERDPRELERGLRAPR